jgi:serine/threonine protein kinase
VHGGVRASRHGDHLAAGPRLFDLGDQRVGADRSIGEGGGSQHRVAQRSDVARPRVVDRLGGGELRDHDLAPELGRRQLDEVLEQHRDVVPPPTKRRQLQLDHAEPMKQILAELSGDDHRREIAVGRGHHSTRDRELLIGADRSQPPGLEHAQELGLRRVWQLADLVEKHGAVGSPNERAGMIAVGPGEGSAAVTKQLRLEQPIGDRCTVERDEWAFAVVTEVVQGSSRQLLAGAGLTVDQHRQRQPGQALELAPERADDLGPPDQAMLRWRNFVGFQFRAQPVGVISVGTLEGAARGFADAAVHAVCVDLRTGPLAGFLRMIFCAWGSGNGAHRSMRRRARYNVRGLIDENETVVSEVLDGTERSGPGLSDTPGIDSPERLFERGQLGHYELLGELGRGGMGVVHAATDTKLNRKVAIKMLRAEGDSRLQQRLVREARALARLTHPNVVRVYEIGEAKGGAFLVMEFIEGVTLRRWLSERPRSVAEILDLFEQAGRGLAAIHAKDLVHRDFKPDNVMVEPNRVLVMDLGVAHGEGGPTVTDFATEPDAADPVLTRTGALLGSPAYMAPEQFSGESVTPKVDQFSFCVALWEAIHGERPFAGATLPALVAAVSSGKRREPRNADAPKWLQVLLERGLAADPDRRFESMQALLDAITRGRGVESSPSRRARVGVAAGMIALLGTAAVFAWPNDAEHEDVVVPQAQPDASTSPPADEQDLRPITAVGDADEPLLSRDGQQLIYVRNQHDFVHVDLRSGETRTLATLERIDHSRLTAAGGLLFSGLVEGQSGSYRIHPLGAAPERIAKRYQFFCEFASRGLLAGSGQPWKHVELVDLESGSDSEQPPGVVEIARDYEFLVDIDCDDANGRVVVLYKVGLNHTLELIDLSGANRRVLLEAASPIALPRFSASGQELFYLVQRGADAELQVIELSGVGGEASLPRAVRPDIKFDHAYARADDGRIAFTRVQGGWSVRRLPADATSLSEAEVIFDSTAEALRVALSPDETQLACIEGHGDLGRLTVRPLAGGEPRVLALTQGMYDVAWSPDGRTLAYAAHHRGEGRVWTVSIDGGTPTVHTETVVGNTYSIIWPRTDTILYQRPGNRNFHVLDPATGSERPLIRDDSVGWAFGPVAAPDTERVALAWNRKDRGVWTIDLDDGTETLLAAGFLYPFEWSHDGRFVYAVSDETSTGDGRIYRIPSTGGEPQVWRPTLVIERNNALSGAAITRADELVVPLSAIESDIWIASGSR